MRKLLVLAATLLSPCVLPPGGLPADAAQARTHTIEMTQMRFGKVPAGIKAGDVIVWVNRDVVPHTATARDGSFNVVLPARQSRRMTVARAGTFPFFCRYHPVMRGVLAAAR